jgi:hypothetical protein
MLSGDFAATVCLTQATPSNLDKKVLVAASTTTPARIRFIWAVPINFVPTSQQTHFVVITKADCCCPLSEAHKTHKYRMWAEIWTPQQITHSYRWTSEGQNFEGVASATSFKVIFSHLLSRAAENLLIKQSESRFEPATLGIPCK